MVTETVKTATDTAKSVDATMPVPGAVLAKPVLESTRAFAPAPNSPGAMVPVTAKAKQIEQHVKTTMERAMTTAEELLTFGQANIEAFVKSSQIWATGLQDLGKTVADSAQAQIEHTVSTFKALAGVKSLREAAELQSTLARTAFEKAVADSGKLTDASLKLAEQALAPITARMTVAAERFGRPVA
jgi:phasin family protein